MDEFLQKMGELFECVLFTASLAKVGSCETSTLGTVMLSIATSIISFLLGLVSMLTPWQTCWTSGGCFALGSSGNHAFSTEEITSKTSAGWAESSEKSLL